MAKKKRARAGGAGADAKTRNGVKKPKGKVVGGDDFFINSGSDDDEDELNEMRQQNQSESEDEEPEETAAERRIRMAKEYLESLDVAEDELSDGVDDAIAHRLQKDVEQEQGTLQRRVAEQFENQSYSDSDVTIYRGHRLSPTCLALSSDDLTAVTGSKDCSIIKWDVETGAKTYVSRGARGRKGVAGHTDQIFTVALSDDGTLLASGGADNNIKVWDVRSNDLIETFGGHRDTVSCLAFRRNSKEMFSGSYDRTIRVWNMEQMGFVESLFGHQSPITCIDSLFRDRALSSGIDKSLRFWKIVDETQLVYKGGHTSSVDSLSMVTEEKYFSGSQDGSVALWLASKKKPSSIVKNAHHGQWISAVHSQSFSDLLCSGSCDGRVRLWKCNTDGPNQNKLAGIGHIPVTGFVNGLRIAKSCRFIAAAVGQEHRLGRWERIQKARNGLQIIPLKSINASANGGNGASKDARNGHIASGHKKEEEEGGQSDGEGDEGDYEGDEGDFEGDEDCE